MLIGGRPSNILCSTKVWGKMTISSIMKFCRLINNYSQHHFLLKVVYNTILFKTRLLLILNFNQNYIPYSHFSSNTKWHFYYQSSIANKNECKMKILKSNVNEMTEIYFCTFFFIIWIQNRVWSLAFHIRTWLENRTVSRTLLFTSFLLKPSWYNNNICLMALLCQSNTIILRS